MLKDEQLEKGSGFELSLQIISKAISSQNYKL